MLSPYLVENRHVAVKRCKHGLFMYNRNDAFIGRSLDLYGEWCDFEVQLLSQFIKPGDTVIDAGANIGTHTVAFANMVGPAGLVHAFEPQRRNFAMLAGNVALNALDNVVCHHKAVGDSNGEIRLPPMPAPEMYFNYAAVAISAGFGTAETVPLVTLDSLDLPACRVIKIDIEGMEPQALKGAQALIARCRPLLYVENNSAESSIGLSPILDALGYTAWWSMFWHFDAHNFYCNTVNVFENTVPAANLFCAPKEANLVLPDHEPFLGAADDWKACMMRLGGRTQR